MGSVVMVRMDLRSASKLGAVPALTWLAGSFFPAYDARSRSSLTRLCLVKTRRSCLPCYDAPKEQTHAKPRQLEHYRAGRTT